MIPSKVRLVLQKGKIEVSGVEHALPMGTMGFPPSLKVIKKKKKETQKVMAQ